MLPFYNNFISKNASVIVDNETETYCLMIPKCATSSLRTLINQYPKRFTQFAFSTKELLPFKDILVFVRDPIERYLSGLATQIKLWNLSAHMVEKTINEDNQIFFLDNHTVPQFWFLLKFGINSPIRFHVKNLHDINLFWPNIQKINARQEIHRLNFLSKTVVDRLEHFFTEDRILFNNFLNQEVHIVDIANRIKKEVTFVKDLEQYKQEINYLI